MSDERLLPVFLAVGIVLGNPGHLAAGDPVTPVQTVTMNEATVVSIPTHPKIALWVSFPEPIADFAGRGFSENPEETRGDFVIRCVSGDRYLVVTPLTPGATGLLHVVVGGRAYSMHFVPSVYERAWQKVLFVAAAPAEDARTIELEEPAVRSAEPPTSTRLEKPGASRLFGLLDLGHWLDELSPAKAKGLVKANKALRWAVKGDRLVEGPLVVRTNWVLRNDILDTLLFSVTLENTGKTALDIVPDSWLVRVEDRVYPCALSDVNPHLAPGKKATAYFAIVGNGEGGPNWLSPDNTFRISLQQAGAAQPRPASSS